MKKYLRKIVAIFAAVTVICTGAVWLYASDYCHADKTAAEAMESTKNISVETVDNMAVFYPQNPKAGLVFYPGGKVEYTAYAPLMHQLAEEGIACVITKMPLNLAVMDINAADDAFSVLSDVEKLYIGGHSLGGSMAASYLDKTENDIEGLILLASYSTADLTDNNTKVLSVYGDKDGVLNMDKYGENLSNLPSALTERVIEGANHAQFGSYGMQKGDGQGEISAKEQLETTADIIADFILN